MKIQALRIAFCLIVSIISVLSSDEISAKEDPEKLTIEFNKLNTSFQVLLERGDLAGSKILSDQILRKINNPGIDSTILSDSYYFIAVYYSLKKNIDASIKYFNLAIELREKIGLHDHRYAKALYNLGTVYYMLGDFKSHEDFSVRSIEVEKKIFGYNSPFLLNTYLTLITANIDLQEYEKSLDYANIALGIADKDPYSISSSDYAMLYSNIGVLYMLLADYSKAKIYLDKAESVFKNRHFGIDENYINLMNSLAITSGELGLSEKSRAYYEKGIELANSSNSSYAYNIVNSYAIILGNSGDKLKGEKLLRQTLDQARIKHGENSRNYYLLLNKYADYLREFSIDNFKAIECYEKCLKYLDINKQDLFLKNLVYIGYSLALTEAGDSRKALEIIQDLLFSEERIISKHGTYDNPDVTIIKPDKRSLKVLKTKYKILSDIYRRTPELATLEAASRTSELIVEMLEKVRINISEEESRLFLGDRYRDSYINAIRDFNILYGKTSDPYYLDKAFEYSEKSKVAGLLTSTRELKAVQFHIPSEIADLEKELQREISLFNARITEESVKVTADMVLINNWKENLMKATRKRDSLIIVFEEQYPDYYAIKYNTRVAALKDVPGIIGKNGNYLNYILSDTLLYIFVANSRHQQLLAVPVDSSFYSGIKKFRSLLSYPSPSDNARKTFEEFKSTGYSLYLTLIKPVVPYLISDELFISPDNIISFIPFETIPVTATSGENILYRNLSYMMNDFDISYTYSATFMAESSKRPKWKSNKVIAFAPNYSRPVEIESVINRQADRNFLPDLPFARLEAQYVSEITGGVLFENNEAKESVYKSEAGKYDIIHLAMHTLLNDKDPMHSTLIFSQGNDTIEDRYLKTYEVYGIPLKANMVVLSSCNTGAGTLYSGEGILSLARGFIYSGSESVVMSMWEIEDRSGTEIVKKFYDYLMKGNSKSVALRKARRSYLTNADQLRSHPYFWSSLVVYGNNAPLYYPRIWLIVPGILLISLILLYIYSRKRRYS